MFEFELGDEISLPRVKQEIEQGLRSTDGKPKEFPERY
jgi:hypothetical protein